jgi:hypothetical protein
VFHQSSGTTIALDDLRPHADYRDQMETQSRVRHPLAAWKNLTCPPQCDRCRTPRRVDARRNRISGCQRRRHHQLSTLISERARPHRRTRRPAPVSASPSITRNGEVRVPAPPGPATTIHNFLLHATAEDSSDDKEYRISVRIHLHNRVTSTWLTPPILTLRPDGPTLPQTTLRRFTVRAQFDDNTVGDLTNHPGLAWGPPRQRGTIRSIDHFGRK